MDYRQLFLIGLGLLVAGAWIVGIRLADRLARRQIGAEVVELTLFSRWGLIMQWLLLGLAILLPLIAIGIALGGDRDLLSLAVDLARSMWLVTMVYGIRRSSRMLIGTNGFAVGPTGFVAWERALAYTWDRDIGQQSWGMTLRIRKGKEEEKKRLFIRRAQRGEVDELFERFAPELAERSREIAAPAPVGNGAAAPTI